MKWVRWFGKNPEQGHSAYTRHLHGTVKLLICFFLGNSCVDAEQAALTLETAIRLAGSRNERVGISEAQVEVARARAARGLSVFFPDLTFTGNYTRRAYETFRTVDGEELAVQRRDAFSSATTVSMLIFDARAIPLYRQAIIEKGAAQLSALDAQRLLAFDAATAFLTALGAAQVRDAAERRMELARSTLSEATVRFRAQLVSSNDVTRAELEQATAERELTQAEGSLNAAYLLLGYVIRTKVKGPLSSPVGLLEAASGPLSEEGTLLSRAEKNRLDLAVRQRRIRALSAFASEPLFRPVPRLGFTGQYRTTNEGGLSNRTRDWFLGVGLTWEVFDGGTWLAERRERRAQVRAADLDLQAQTRRVALDVQSAVVALESAQATVRQAEVATAIAKRNAEQTAELYRQGLAGALEVADANLRLFEADVALARGRYGLGLAFLDLRAALGFDPFGEEPGL